MDGEWGGGSLFRRALPHPGPDVVELGVVEVLHPAPHEELGELRHPLFPPLVPDHGDPFDPLSVLSPVLVVDLQGTRSTPGLAEALTSRVPQGVQSDFTLMKTTLLGTPSRVMIAIFWPGELV